MSRKACLLTSEDVPKYIKQIVKRLSPVNIDFEDEEGTWWGYAFKLSAKWKCGYENQLIDDTEKLIKWCQSWYAHSEVIKYCWWYDEYPSDGLGNWYYRKRKAWREGFRNHALLIISDPVAHRFEKDNYYKNLEL